MCLSSHCVPYRVLTWSVLFYRGIIDTRNCRCSHLRRGVTAAVQLTDPVPTSLRPWWGRARDSPCLSSPPGSPTQDGLTHRASRCHGRTGVQWPAYSELWRWVFSRPGTCEWPSVTVRGGRWGQVWALCLRTAEGLSLPRRPSQGGRQPALQCRVRFVGEAAGRGRHGVLSSVGVGQAEPPGGAGQGPRCKSRSAGRRLLPTVL